MHTVFSDGFIFPEDLAKSISSLDSTGQGDVLAYSGLGSALDFLISRGDEARADSIRAAAERSVEVAKNLKTVAVTDHNTLLGAEGFVSAMERHAPGRRVVVGTELTALANFTATGPHPIHMSVYFYDDDGFDIMERGSDGRQEFFRAISEDYLPLINRMARANNHRFVNELRRRCNDYFFDGEEMVAEKELVELAESRVHSRVDPGSVINLGNSTVTVFQTDIADYLSLTGVRGTGAEITQKYFRREGPLYTPLRGNEFSSSVDELAAELSRISGSSKVRVKKGIAHPSTYVRVIARTLLRDCGKDPDSFYWSWAEDAGTRQVLGIVDSLAGRGLIDLVESDYPRYFRQPPGADDPEAFTDYLDFLYRETEFVVRQRGFWRKAASERGLRTSGGSDAHFRRGTPNLGYGFCDLDFDDSRVDEIFR